jgi:predicted ATPase
MVETHSEHILLRLQRRVAEKKIDPGRVGVYYFDQTPDGTIMRNVSFDESGNFSGEIPEGFFEEGFKEALARLKALKPSRD